MKDWMIRSIKTFVEAFGCIFIPEVCLLLNGGWPEDWYGVKAALIPIGCSALAAGITAAWNIILEHLRENK